MRSVDRPAGGRERAARPAQGRPGLIATATAVLLSAAACVPGAEGDLERAAVAAEGSAARDTCSVWSEFRGILGASSEKIRREGDRVFVWAGGAPSGPDAEWFEFTDAPIDPAELQYGLGRDAIRSIDVPHFVEPDDPRLLDIPPSPYRRCERPETTDEIMVIGYVAAGRPRAYPTALLDRHEVLNEEANGKPFTVGW